MKWGLDIKNILSFRKFENRKAKHELIFAMTVVVSIVFLVLFNVSSKLLTDKFSLKFDLTKNKVFSLTSDSVEFISSLGKEVKIIVLNSKEKFLANGDYYEQASMVIDEYAKYSDKIEVSYVDLSENPSIKVEYGGEDLTDNSIIVKSGENYQVLMPSDLFNTQYFYMRERISSSKAEQAMTAAIVNVTSESKVKINFLTGFGESENELAGFSRILQSNNYDVESISMLTGDIQQDSSLVCICAPSRDYDDETITKLKSYLENDGNYGKNVVYFINSEQKVLENLANFVKDWGISINEGFVFETNESKILMSGQPFLTICEYETGSQYIEKIKDQSIPVAIPFSRPLEVLDESRVETILRFSKTVGIYPESAGSEWRPGEGDINKGPIPCLLVSSSKNEETDKKSRLVVVSAVTAINESLLSRNMLNNSSCFLNLFNSLTEKEETVNIEPKIIGVNEMLVDPQIRLILGLIFMAVLPVLVLLIGLIVWILKRRK